MRSSMMPEVSNEDARPIRVIVEVVSNEAVRRLEASDEDVLQKVKALEKRIEGLNRTIYELMDVIGRLRNKR